jgi:hypothetical protein
MGIQTAYVSLDAAGIPPERTQSAIVILLIGTYAVVFFFSNLFFAFTPLLRSIGGLFFIASPLPLFLINNKKRSLSSIISVALAGLFLVYVAFVIFPAIR